jgi:hypothetical protein
MAAEASNLPEPHSEWFVTAAKAERRRLKSATLAIARLRRALGGPDWKIEGA